MDTKVAETATVASRSRDVVSSAGIAMALLLATAAITLRDVEAGAFAAAGVIVVALIRFRTGLIGMLGVLLLSGDVIAWMAPGAYSNLTHEEGFWEIALPSMLTVAATTAGLGALADLAGRRWTAARGVSPRTIGTAGVVFALAALVVPLVGFGDATVARPGDIEVVTEDVRFADDDLSAGAGEIGVVVANRDLFWHTFTITELDVNVNVPVGAERRVTFEAAAGTYRFVCVIPGHEQAGMDGRLTVR